MPIDRGTIDAQLRDIGEGDRWWEQREFRDLPHILHPGEQLRGLIHAKLLGRRRPRIFPAGRWLVVATDQRLLCLRHERLGRKQMELAAGEITRVHSGGGLRGWRLVVETADRRLRMAVDRADSYRFQRALAGLMPGANGPAGLDDGTESLLAGPRPTLPMVGGLVAKLSPARAAAPDAPTRAQVDRLETTVERLQGDVERLQQQVAFLEELMRRSPVAP